MQKKQKPSTETDWSPWEWSHERNCYYSCRYNHLGKLEYAFREYDSSNVPRTAEDPVMNQLSSDIGNIGLDSTSYEEPQHHHYTDQGTYSTDRTAHDHSASSQYTHRPGYHQQSVPTQSHSSSHSHQHSYSHPHPSSYGQPRSHSHSYSHSSKDKGKGKAKGKGVADTGYYDKNPVEEHVYTNAPLDPHARAASYDTGHRSYDDNYYREADEAAAVQQALSNSRVQQYGHGHQGGGESSYSSGAYDTNTFDPSVYAPDPHPHPAGDTTPRGSGTASTSYGSASTSRHSHSYTIHGTPGAVEQVDPRFVVESSYKFQPGEVFKILWSEPMGAVGADEPISDMQSIAGASGRFYVGYRRFIIVSTDDSHHSTCVPILTYDRRGCSKPGVKASKHGIVYAVGNKPKILKNERDLGFKPVAVDIYADGESLAKESRVNYSKLVTIEHNVKVFFIGRLHPDHLDIVAYAVNKCWEDKRHTGKKSKK
ncbi:hypothetical protein F5Y18DRAFT_430399 [Xylariaceae sp. FL1019]|nr:hypothetical protein F5Y18DRAFT_430399 [Xylariaceae sp. FL1019]